MCGIAGIVNLNHQPVDETLLAAMNGMQHHRGPDDEGIKILGSVGLAHQRLSIIDLGSGHQPLGNENETIWVTYNGEIYNHRELRQDLEAKGHHFKTDCDTEILVHLYEEHGSHFVERLNGMFAFAIYDANLHRLLLARDRLGQKPLVYFRTKNTLAFASELQSLEKLPDMPREINLQALHDYLTLQYVPCPATIFTQVHKLPPGQLLDINLADGSNRLRDYWHCRYDEKSNLKYADAREQLRELLEDATRKRLMSDVPLGAFLSGGIDSTIVVGLMSKLCREPVKTFTIGFDHAIYDERKFAQSAAEFHGTEHREKVVNPEDFGIVEKLVKHYGEPYSDASMLPTFLLSQFTREHVTVALSGDGADEMFAGYYRYLVLKFAKFADLCPTSLRRPFCRALAGILPSQKEERTLSGKLQRLLSVTATAAPDRYLDIINRFPEAQKRAVYGERFKEAELFASQEYLESVLSTGSVKDPVESIIEAELNTYLPGDILTKVDIASMACSLELRSPFLDYRVAEFAASLPLKFKQCGRSRKHILRDACKDLIPANLKKREKQGFGVPVAAWFRAGWKDLLQERLLDGKAVSDGFFQRKELAGMIQEHQSSRADHSYSLWALLIFELWLNR